MPKHPPLDTPAAVRDYVDAELRNAVTDPSHPWHWPVLTTGGDSRVVVLRDYRADLPAVTWYTDRRAAKTTQLRHAAGTALMLFYSASHRIQLRLDGEAVEATQKARRLALWQNVKGGARANYATSSAPGTRLDSAGNDLPSSWPALTPAQEEEAFHNFAVYDFALRSAELLQLLDTGALRSTWQLPKGSFSWITP